MVIFLQPLILSFGISELVFEEKRYKNMLVTIPGVVNFDEAWDFIETAAGNRKDDCYYSGQKQGMPSAD